MTPEEEVSVAAIADERDDLRARVEILEAALENAIDVASTLPQIRAFGERWLAVLESNRLPRPDRDEVAYIENLKAHEVLYWASRDRGWRLNDKQCGDILRLVAPVLAEGPY